MTKKPSHFHLLSNFDDEEPSGEYFYWDESGDFLMNQAETKILSPVNPLKIEVKTNAK